jgi:DNA primase
MARSNPGRSQSGEQRVATLRTHLLDVAGQVRTAADWTQCLRIAARLPDQSWANVLLISSRMPDATLVRGYEAWRSAGRQVNRDEKGIEIFSADNVTYVWDLSQTGGQPLPAPAAIPPPPREISPDLWDCLCWLARREGFAVEREPGCPPDGTTLWTARHIRVLPGPADRQAIWALAHQLGHVLLHNTIPAPPGTSTSGCEGIRKAEADSVAFLICTRHGVLAEHVFAGPSAWAGTDPRAQPGAAILAAGERIITAAGTISRYLDQHLPGNTAGRTVPAQAKTAIGVSFPGPDPRIEAILLDAEAFYAGQLAGSWVPVYLRERGITANAVGEWHIGYAPRGWTTLLAYLRGRGHHDDEIQAAGLARISSRGTLIDHFRDRVMLPVHEEQGTIAGFIGRAHPNAGPGVPKYLNTPETSAYKKGNLLFGLYQARDRLARGAVPVIAEGPFDAIAVTLAGQHSYVGLAPCGTALTSAQIEALSRIADLRQAGILAAFDDDTAGRKAAVRAYELLRATSDRLQAVALPGKDPAEVLESEGAAALYTVLCDRVEPLSALVIDAYLEPWERRLRDTEGPLLAMRSVATVIADLLPTETAEAIRRITGNQELAMVDEHMQPIANPALPQIASKLPADTAFQITRAAERLGFTDYSDVLAEVANAIIRKTFKAKGNPYNATPVLVEANFPRPPLAARANAAPTSTPTSRITSHSKPPRSRPLPSSRAILRRLSTT